MKRIFIIFLCFIPFVVKADLVKDLEVIHGSLSRNFESTNNYYSVTLDDGFSALELNYSVPEGYDAKIVNGNYGDSMDHKAILEVSKDGKIEEEYVFYLNKGDTSVPVFTEKSDEVKIIPYLKEYVIITCIFLILLLFKVVVIGFRK